MGDLPCTLRAFLAGATNVALAGDVDCYIRATNPLRDTSEIFIDDLGVASAHRQHGKPLSATVGPRWWGRANV